MITAQWMLAICLLAPFVAAGLSALLYKRETLRDIVNLTAPFVSLLAGAGLILSGQINVPILLRIGTFVGDIPIAFGVEPMGLVFAGLIGLLWPVAMLYTLAYMIARKSADLSRFLAFYNISVGSALAIAFSSNLLTLFIFYEVLTLSTYPLVTHSKSQQAQAAGRLYLATLLGTSTLFLLVAIIGIWYLSGRLDFVVGGVLQDAVEPALAGWLLLLVVAGTAKAAIMPFHKWLPRAMVAPVPVSALLHAVAVVKAGVFTIIKVMVYIFGIDLLAEVSVQWLMYLSGATIIIASFIALAQANLKALLAYSTISQLSYIVLAATLLKPIALSGAVLHMVAHGFGKITLFFAAGAVETVSGKTRTEQLAGIGKQMPWTMGAFTLAVLSIIGLPPLVGFSSKWFLLSGATLAEQYFVVAVIIVSTLLNAMYFLPIVYRAFFQNDVSQKQSNLGEAPLAMLLAMIFPAFMCFMLFFYATEVVRFIEKAL